MDRRLENVAQRIEEHLESRGISRPAVAYTLGAPDAAVVRIRPQGGGGFAVDSSAAYGGGARRQSRTLCASERDAADAVSRINRTVTGARGDDAGVLKMLSDPEFIHDNAYRHGDMVGVRIRAPWCTADISTSRNDEQQSQFLGSVWGSV